MHHDPSHSSIAFTGDKRVASGPLREVALAVRSLCEAGDGQTVLLFDAVTSEPIDLDLRGTAEEVLTRLGAGSGVTAAEPGPAHSPAAQPPQRRAPGRPRLGVVAREVTLLPRHWQWLSEQPGGASVTLRKLVEEAARSTAGEVRQRQAREACYRFMNAMAGNRPGFEEATRALFAGDRDRFARLVDGWPPDIRDHARRLAEGAFPGRPNDGDRN